MGLAIVRHIIELHGGEVLANSQGFDLGSTFTITLPLIPKAEKDPQLANSFQANNFLALQNLRVLLVEDERDSREIITLILEQHGAEVVAVESVARALMEYSQQQLDILISDISMPLEDGYSSIAKIRRGQSEKSSIPAIALTAHASRGDEQLALTAGFNLHLSKPVQSDLLIESILLLLQ